MNVGIYLVSSTWETWNVQYHAWIHRLKTHLISTCIITDQNYNCCQHIHVHCSHLWYIHCMFYFIMFIELQKMCHFTCAYYSKCIQVRFQYLDVSKLYFVPTLYSWSLRNISDLSVQMKTYVMDWIHFVPVR